MSSWTDYKIPTVMVEDGSGVKRPVRGLTLDDLSALVVSHLDEMMEITTLYIQSKKDVLAVTNMNDLIVVASKSFPGFVSEVISMVTDTPELADKALPAALQINIIASAVKLTVQDAGDMGNLSAILQNAVRAAVAQRGEVSQKLAAILSPDSIMDAGRTPAS